MPAINYALLGSLFKTSSGGTPLKARQEYYVGGDVPWLLSGEVAQGEIWAATNFITRAGLQNSSAKIFPKNTVLVAMYGATAGEVGLLRVEATTNQAICGIFPNDRFLPEYLYYLLRSKKDELVGKAAGNAQPNISQAKIRETLIPLTEKAEQRRIVAILDEAFEGIATAKANAEKNLQNSRELFTNHLERVFAQRGASWHEAPLLSFTSAISTGPFGSLLHKSDYVSDGVPLVNPINIVDGLIIPDPNKLIDSKTRQRLQSYVLRAGDIVVGRRGEIGRCAVVGPNEAGWVCGTGCFFVRPLPAVRPAFIAHLIRSREYRAQLERASTGATMKNLSNTALGELNVAVPPIVEQDKALGLIGQLSEDCGRLEDVCERKLGALDELKKSLLHQAFTGALTAKTTDQQVAEVA